MSLYLQTEVILKQRFGADNNKQLIPFYFLSTLSFLCDVMFILHSLLLGKIIQDIKYDKSTNLCDNICIQRRKQNRASALPK